MAYWTRGPLLGSGSTATVFLASDPISGELFAVKSTNLSSFKSFESEKSIHSSLSSPYVISYLGDDSDNNIFLEYASGGSISDLIKKQKLPDSKIRCFVRDILLGLSHLHSQKIAHCDIKSQNILICSDGRAKIADLGCAKYVDSDDRNKVELRGTPMFMAPEVAKGEGQGLASDVWALGCTIVEMATGRAPWTNVLDAGSLLYRVGFTNEVPDLPEWNSDAGKDFMRRCFVKDADKRWSVDELLMHPFVSGLDLDTLTGMDVGCKHATPKSVMENNIWDLGLESEEEDVVDFGSNPVLDLIGDGPDWSWDDSWQTVRDESMSLVDYSSQITAASITAATSEELSELFDSDDVSVDELGVIISESCTSEDNVPIVLITNNIFRLVGSLVLSVRLIVPSFKILCLVSIASYERLATEIKDTARLENPIVFHLGACPFIFL